MCQSEAGLFALTLAFTLVLLAATGATLVLLALVLLALIAAEAALLAVSLTTLLLASGAALALTALVDTAGTLLVLLTVLIVVSHVILPFIVVPASGRDVAKTLFCSRKFPLSCWY
jgi:hypothetical protein